jgi:hypothetical protein
MKRSVSFLLLILFVACNVEQQRKVVDPQLGYSVVFPATTLVYPGTSVEIQKNKPEWVALRTVESTPFGEIQWFSRTSILPGRFDRNYTVEVGNLPPGEQGGANQEEILAPLKQWNSLRFPGPIVELEGSDGPGFEYFHKRPADNVINAGNVINGIIVFRRGRIHHARGSSPDPKDPLLVNFLKSFQVDP